MVLAFGIISLFFCGIIFGAIAWVMGKSDLEQMRAGTMDPAGESMTTVGRILGIIGLVKDLLGLLIFILVMLGMFTVQAARVGQ